MGKAKRIKVSAGEKRKTKVGLADQIEADKSVTAKNRQKIRNRNDDDEEVSSYLLTYYLKI